MNAADLFKKQILETKPHVILKRAATNYWSILKPPYKTQDIFTIIITFFLFLTIPLTVFVATQVRDNRSKAASGPIAFFEENFKKLNMKFAAQDGVLTLINKVDDDTLPQPEIDKKAGKNVKVISFDIEQTDKLSSPLHSFSHEITIKVNDKGEALNQDAYFSIQVLDIAGTVTISLAGKDLLKVGI